jgi:hypothetical protein
MMTVMLDERDKNLLRMRDAWAPDAPLSVGWHAHTTKDIQEGDSWGSLIMVGYEEAEVCEVYESPDPDTPMSFSVKHAGLWEQFVGESLAGYDNHADSVDMAVTYFLICQEISRRGL